MESRKRKLADAVRNEFLDQSDSEADASDNDHSEDDGFRKGGALSKKRQPLEDEGEYEAEDDLEVEDEDLSFVDILGSKNEPPKSTKEPDSVGVMEAAQAVHAPERTKKARTVDDLPSVSKPILRKNLVVTDAAIKKSGVVYLGKVPPYMKPNKLRLLLSPFGTINRLFLVPEDPEVRKKRVRNHGNKKTCYTEGWVEFTRKLDAKQACELLNGRNIGGKKSSYYRDDVWSLIYLKGFKWHHMTEQIAQENAERTARLRAEISRTTKENKEFVRNVEAAKMLDGMLSKAAARDKSSAPVEKPNEDLPDAPRKLDKTGKRSYTQIPPAKRRQTAGDQPEQVARVLSKIF
jgi:ESF2/ABP1 family protein